MIYVVFSPKQPQDVARCVKLRMGYGYQCEVESGSSSSQEHKQQEGEVVTEHEEQTFDRRQWRCRKIVITNFKTRND